MVSCWEIAGLLALLFMMFSCVLVTFPCGVLGQVWYLIISIPDLCLLTYFYKNGKNNKQQILYINFSIKLASSQIRKKKQNLRILFLITFISPGDALCTWARQLFDFL